MKSDEFVRQVGACYVALVLDPRREYDGEFPLAVRYTINRKQYYYRIGGRVTKSEFESIVNTSLTRGRQSSSTASRKETKEQWRGILDKHVERLEAASKHSTPTLESIKAMLTGKSNSDSFIGLWREIISEKKHGTAVSYEAAMKSFMNLTGFSESDGFLISKETIHKWVQRLTDEGKAKATIGIYLRSIRVPFKECVKRGYIQPINYPFSEKDGDKVSIPSGSNRKHQRLTVEQMIELYNIFVKKKYPKEWGKAYRDGVNESLGLFLFMYLANGMNLADVARLTYNDYYIQTKRKGLLFNRTKTKDRTDNDSEVIVPIIPELKSIIDELAAPFEKDERLFPGLLQDAVTEAEIARRVQQENQNTKKHIRKLTESLGWELQPSPTWCRHSFATNLSHAGVPRQYITEAMGHSSSEGGTTQKYIDTFPLEMQMEYNSLLLKTKQSIGLDDILSKVEKMSVADMEKLQELINKMKK